MEAIITFLTTYIDFTERKFLEAVFYSFLCWALWVLVPHLQFKYKILSRFTDGDEGKACDFLCWFLIQTGAMRNFAFEQAMANGKHIEYGNWAPLVYLISYPMMFVGFSLVVLSFYRLGLRGMYFGDHFGFLFKEKITAFPYNYVANPQYVGTTLLFTGISAANGSPVGLFLTLLVNVLYRVLYIVEGSKLEQFYPSIRAEREARENAKAKAN